MSLEFNTTPGELTVGQGLKYVDNSTVFTTSQKQKTIAVDSQAGFNGGTFLGLTFNPTGLLTGTNPAVLGGISSTITDNDTIQGDGTSLNTIRLKKVYVDDDTIQGDGTSLNTIRLKKVYVDDDTIQGDGTSLNTIRLKKAYADGTTIEGDGTSTDPFSLAQVWVGGDGMTMGSVTTLNQYGQVTTRALGYNYNARWTQVQDIANATETTVKANNLSASWYHNTANSFTFLTEATGIWNTPAFAWTIGGHVTATCNWEPNASATGHRSIRCIATQTGGTYRQVGKQSQMGSATSGANGMSLACTFWAPPGTFAYFSVYQNAGVTMTNQEIHCSFVMNDVQDTY